MWQKPFVDLLTRCFEELRRKNPRFSARAYARMLGVSPSALSQIMKGSPGWKLSARRAASMLDRMGAKKSEKRRLYALMGLTPELNKVQLPREKYKVLEDGRYFSVLFHFDLGLSVPEIAARTGITAMKVEEIASELASMRLLRRESRYRFVRDKEFILTTDGVPDLVIRNYHVERLKFAEEAVLRVPVRERDVTSLTFVGSRARLKELSAEIRKLHERAVLLMDAEEENDEVYQLSVAVVPLSWSPGKAGQ